MAEEPTQQQPADSDPDDWRLQAESLYATGRYDEAIESYDRALQLRPDDAGALRGKAAVLTALDRLEEALANYDKALQLDPDDLDSLNNKAGVLTDLGRHEDARLLAKETAAARERVLGAEQSDAIESENNPAVDRSVLNRYEEAARLDEQTLTTRVRVLGPDHPDTLSTRSNLAADHRRLGRYEEALTLDEETLAARERILGPDHPDTLSSRSNLGADYRRLGRYDEAARVDEVTLAMRERALGPDHPDTLSSRSNLAADYRALGRLEDAVSLDEGAQPPPSIARAEKPAADPISSSAAEQTEKQGTGDTPEPPPAPEPTPIGEAPEPLDILARAISDLPTETDLLGFAPLVDGLHTLLQSDETKLPLAIAITAPWGAGKSSVMKQLKRRLRDPDPPAASPEHGRRWHTVWLDAWKYEKSERLWAALAKAIYDQAHRERRWWERVSFRLRVEWRRLGRWALVPKILWRLAVGAAAFGALFLLGWLAGGVGAGAATGTVAGVVAIAAEGTRLWASGALPFKRSLESYVSKPRHEEHLGFTQEASEDIDHMLNALMPSEQDAVTIFVDDLDRCSSAHTVEIIEAVNQIFNSSEHRRCVFILGMDREVVAASIEVAHKEVVDHLRQNNNPLADDYGVRFLSKIVQLSVAIPPPNPTDIEALLRNLTGSTSEADRDPRPIPKVVDQFAEELRRSNPENPVEVREARNAIEPDIASSGADARALDEAERVVRAERFRKDSPDMQYAEFEALRTLDRNPRQVKRFDNAFRLQLYIANRTPGQTLDFERDQLVALGKWVALRLRWPHLAWAMDHDREQKLLAALEKKANRRLKDANEADSPYAAWLANAEILECLRERKKACRISSLGPEVFLRIA